MSTAEHLECFISGLRSDIRCALRSLRPFYVPQAFQLAQQIEAKLKLTKSTQDLKASFDPFNDSLLQTIHDLREEERSSALPNPKDRLPELTGSDVVDSPEAAKAAVEKAIFNAIDITISHSSTFAQSLPISADTASFDTGPYKFGALESPLFQAATSFINLEPQPLPDSVSLSPPVPPPPKPPESGTFTSSKRAISTTKPSLARSLVSLPLLKLPDVNQTLTPQPKPPDPSLQRPPVESQIIGEPIMPPPPLKPPEPPDKFSVPPPKPPDRKWDQPQPLEHHRPTKDPSVPLIASHYKPNITCVIPMASLSSTHVHSLALLIAVTASKISSQPLDLHLSSISQSQPLSKSIIRVLPASTNQIAALVTNFSVAFDMLTNGMGQSIRGTCSMGLVTILGLVASWATLLKRTWTEGELQFSLWRRNRFRFIFSGSLHFTHVRMRNLFPLPIVQAFDLEDKINLKGLVMIAKTTLWADPRGPFRGPFT